MRSEKRILVVRKHRLYGIEGLLSELQEALHWKGLISGLLSNHACTKG
jgi:hypothetical protein